MRIELEILKVHERFLLRPGKRREVWNFGGKTLVSGQVQNVELQKTLWKNLWIFDTPRLQIHC